MIWRVILHQGHQAGTACSRAYLRILSTIIRFGADIPERLGVLAAELLPEKPVIVHQEKLDVLEIGGLVVVAQQRQFLALLRQFLPQPRARRSRAGPFPLFAIFTRTL